MTKKSEFEFAKGDHVICTRIRETDTAGKIGEQYFWQFTVGKTYVVGGSYFMDTDNEHGRIAIESDDRGRCNGWAAAFFAPGGGPW